MPEDGGNNRQEGTVSFHRALAAGLLLAWALSVLCLWFWRGWGWEMDELHAVFPSGFHPGNLAEQARALASFTMLTLAALGWGRLAGRPFQILPSGNPAARAALLLLIGHAIQSLSIFLIGIAGLLPWGLVIPFLGVLFLRRPNPEALREASHLLRSGWPRVWVIIGTVALAFSFILCFAPVSESDALRYHLFGPQEYLKAGRIHHLPYNAFTNLPFQTNMLFMAASWAGTFRASHFVHWTYLPLIWVLASLVTHSLLRSAHAALGRRPDGCPPHLVSWSVAAGTLAISAPVILVISNWPNVDLSTCAYILGALWVLMPGSLRKVDSRMLLAGFLAGAAIGTKLSAVTAVALLGIAVVGMALRTRRAARLICVFGLASLICPAPYLLKNMAYHGNPLYPAAYGLFGGEEWSEANDLFYKGKAAEKGFGRRASDLLLSPLDITVRWRTWPRELRHIAPPPVTAREQLVIRLFGRESPGFEDHNPGPLVLALLVPGILLAAWLAGRRPRSATGWLVLLQLGGGWLAWFLTYQSVRFLLVQIVLTAVAGTTALAVLARCQKWIRALGMAALIMMAAGGLSWYFVYTLLVSPSVPLAAALGAVEKEEVLEVRLNSYTAVQWLNTEAVAEESVLYVGEFRGLYAEFLLLSSDWFDTPRVLAEIRATQTNEEMLARLESAGVRYVLYNGAELLAYSRAYFRPRFSDEEWDRYVDFITRLAPTVVFQPREGVMVFDLARLPEAAQAEAN